MAQVLAQPAHRVERHRSPGVEAGTVPRVSTAEVDAFHAAGIAAGGTDDGPPGLRPGYHEHYYGAFLIDPDGNRIEAVTFPKDDAEA